MNTATDPIEMDERGLLVTCPHCEKRNRMPYQQLGQSFRCGQCHIELPAPAEPVEIRSAGGFDALTAHSSIPVLADFWAPWCGPCKMTAPELAKVAAEEAGRVLIVKVNTEEVPDLAARFGISAIPTLALFKDGRESARQVGALRAPAIRHFIQNSH